EARRFVRLVRQGLGCEMEESRKYRPAVRWSFTTECIRNSLEILSEVSRRNPSGGKHCLSPSDVVRKHGFRIIGDRLGKVVEMERCVLVAFLAATLTISCRVVRSGSEDQVGCFRGSCR